MTGNSSPFAAGDNQREGGLVMPRSSWLIPLLAGGLGSACALDVAPFPPSHLDGNIGLDLNLINGRSAGLVVLPDRGFYVNQLRFQVNQKKFPAPDVLDWVQSETEFSALDWSGTTRMNTTWSKTRDGTYQELRPYSNATWMADHPTFRLEFYDDAGQLVAGPITLGDDGFVIARQTGLVWVDGEPGQGDYGANSSPYAAMTIATGGAFTAQRDDVYSVQVSALGPMDGTAEVDITSARGDNKKGVAVVSGVPIALGSSGASITFTDGASPSTLMVGDRWIVRCTSGQTPSIGNATPGVRASFSAVAEIRFQFPESKTAPVFHLPASTHELRVFWSQKPDQPYSIPVTIAPEPPVDYGLKVHLTVSPPQNGAFYVPGETFNLAVDLFDGNGNRLHDPGALPTYRQFLMGASGGIQYYTFNTDPSAGFFTENRLDLMKLAVYGPTDRVQQNYTTQPTTAFFVDDVNVPDMTKVVNAGLAPGSMAWDIPVANNVDVALPADAQPGSYIALAKVARSWYGQVIYREEHVVLQVGTDQPTDFDPDVGNCAVCHTGEARLDRLRHAISTEEPHFCMACHVRPNNTPIGVVVHRIHFFSAKYPVRKSGCSLCHLDPDSNTRVSIAFCGACHGDIHPGENMTFDPDPYVQCGQTCHKVLPDIHVVAKVR